MYIKPMLLDDTSKPFESEEHIGELKIDGIRGIISNQEHVRIYSRHHNEITSRFTEIQTAAAEAVDRGTILDGELVVTDVTTGKPDFSATMSHFHSKRRIEKTPGLCYVAFDILAHRGIDTTALPLMTRKEILEEALRENDFIKRIRYFERGFVPLFDLCRSEELEGIVLKRRDSRYYVGQRPKGIWQRAVVFKREECVVTGFSKKSVAWSIGIVQNGTIVPVGLLEYGINGAMGKDVFSTLQKTVVRETKDFAFVEPRIHIGVRFRHWTKAGKMRLPVLERVIG
ncbi:SPBc2 prophage-derived DNA ligase-like protein LigB [Paenibacillus dendritiformis]|uniref:ATP-dependent DNA ligase n=1 Tax=Paenibacillus TaxID=44249 RepID=UPI001B077676|nr:MULTISPECIES: hypothetical protein [Paenibacillus]MEB9896490.1 hypothetical protein [Bacillus cereus]GIO82362.1 SPBc2 prophage-derived DNA ligase-like protein LigB [Paenibacillus dendritiformis]CAH8721237.1 hypothetical protein HTL2_006258 [Paenibacillus melissococcoides]